MSYLILIIFGVAGLLAIGAVILLVFLKPKKKGLSQEVFAGHWSKIKTMVSSGDLISIRQSVVEADKLLDLVLKKRVSGENLGMRLKNAESIFKNRSNYSQAWEAHKLRNRLVHEVGYDASESVCKNAIRGFENAFRDLGYVI